MQGESTIDEDTSGMEGLIPNLEDDSEDEIFFGPITEKERKKFNVYGKRKTDVYFRRSHIQQQLVSPECSKTFEHADDQHEQETGEIQETEDDSEDEVFFGPLTKKEIKKYNLYGRRKTECIPSSEAVHLLDDFNASKVTENLNASQDLDVQCSLTERELSLSDVASEKNQSIESLIPNEAALLMDDSKANIGTENASKDFDIQWGFPTKNKERSTDDIPDVAFSSNEPFIPNESAPIVDDLHANVKIENLNVSQDLDIQHGSPTQTEVRLTNNLLDLASEKDQSNESASLVDDLNAENVTTTQDSDLLWGSPTNREAVSADDIPSEMNQSNESLISNASASLMDDLSANVGAENLKSSQDLDIHCGSPEVRSNLVSEKDRINESALLIDGLNASTCTENLNMSNVLDMPCRSLNDREARSIETLSDVASEKDESNDLLIVNEPDVLLKDLNVSIGAENPNTSQDSGMHYASAAETEALSTDNISDVASEMVQNNISLISNVAAPLQDDLNTSVCTENLNTSQDLDLQDLSPTSREARSTDNFSDVFKMHQNTESFISNEAAPLMDDLNASVRAENLNTLQDTDVHCCSPAERESKSTDNLSDLALEIDQSNVSYIPNESAPLMDDCHASVGTENVDMSRGLDIQCGSPIGIEARSFHSLSDVSSEKDQGHESALLMDDLNGSASTENVTTSRDLDMQCNSSMDTQARSTDDLSDVDSEMDESNESCFLNESAPLMDDLLANVGTENETTSQDLEMQCNSSMDTQARSTDDLSDVNSEMDESNESCFPNESAPLMDHLPANVGTENVDISQDLDVQCGSPTDIEARSFLSLSDVYSVKDRGNESALLMDDLNAGTKNLSTSHDLDIWCGSSTDTQAGSTDMSYVISKQVQSNELGIANERAATIDDLNVSANAENPNTFQDLDTQCDSSTDMQESSNDNLSDIGSGKDEKDISRLSCNESSPVADDVHALVDTGSSSAIHDSKMENDSSTGWEARTSGDLPKSTSDTDEEGMLHVPSEADNAMKELDSRVNAEDLNTSQSSSSDSKSKSFNQFLDPSISEAIQNLSNLMYSENNETVPDTCTSNGEMKEMFESEHLNYSLCPISDHKSDSTNSEEHITFAERDSVNQCVCIRNDTENKSIENLELEHMHNISKEHLAPKYLSSTPKTLNLVESASEKYEKMMSSFILDENACFHDEIEQNTESEHSTGHESNQANDKTGALIEMPKPATENSEQNRSVLIYDETMSRMNENQLFLNISPTESSASRSVFYDTTFALQNDHFEKGAEITAKHFTNENMLSKYKEDLVKGSVEFTVSEEVTDSGLSGNKGSFGNTNHVSELEKSLDSLQQSKEETLQDQAQDQKQRTESLVDVLNISLSIENDQSSLRNASTNGNESKISITEHPNMPISVGMDFSNASTLYYSCRDATSSQGSADSNKEENLNTSSDNVDEKKPVFHDADANEPAEVHSKNEISFIDNVTLDSLLHEVQSVSINENFQLVDLASSDDVFNTPSSGAEFTDLVSSGERTANLVSSNNDGDLISSNDKINSADFYPRCNYFTSAPSARMISRQTKLFSNVKASYDFLTGNDMAVNSNTELFSKEHNGNNIATLFECNTDFESEKFVNYLESQKNEEISPLTKFLTGQEFTTQRESPLIRFDHSFNTLDKELKTEGSQKVQVDLLSETITDENLLLNTCSKSVLNSDVQLCTSKQKLNSSSETSFTVNNLVSLSPDKSQENSIEYKNAEQEYNTNDKNLMKTCAEKELTVKHDIPLIEVTACESPQTVLDKQSNDDAGKDNILNFVDEPWSLESNVQVSDSEIISRIANNNEFDNAEETESDLCDSTNSVEKTTACPKGNNPLDMQEDFAKKLTHICLDMISNTNETVGTKTPSSNSESNVREASLNSLNQIRDVKENLGFKVESTVHHIEGAKTINKNLATSVTKKCDSKSKNTPQQPKTIPKSAEKCLRKPAQTKAIIPPRTWHYGFSHPKLPAQAPQASKILKTPSIKPQKMPLFKTPQKTTGSATPTFRTPLSYSKRFNVSSPVAQYIRDRPAPPLIRNIRQKTNVVNTHERSVLMGKDGDSSLISGSGLNKPERPRKWEVENQANMANLHSPSLPPAKYSLRSSISAKLRNMGVTKNSKSRNEELNSKHQPSPRIMKHCGASKTLQWAAHLELDSPDLLSSPSRVPAEAQKSILVNRSISEDDNTGKSSVLSHSLLEHSVVEEVRLKTTHTLEKPKF